MRVQDPRAHSDPYSEAEPDDVVVHSVELGFFSFKAYGHLKSELTVDVRVPLNGATVGLKPGTSEPGRELVVAVRDEHGQWLEPGRVKRIPVPESVRVQIITGLAQFGHGRRWR